MSCLLGKFYDLILYGRTISGTGSLYDTCIYGRAVNILADDRVCLLIRISQKAGDLFDLDIRRVSGIGEGNNNFVSLLDRHLGVIQSPAVHSGGSSCLESSKRDPDPVQGILEAGRSLHAAGAGLRDGFSNETSGVEICAGTYNSCLASVNGACMDSYADYFAAFSQDLSDFCLSDRQVLLALKHLSHGLGILRFVSLCPQRMDCRSLGDIEHLGLDESLIDIFTHLSAQGIDFSDQMSLR